MAVLLVLYLMAASACWGAMMAWAFDRDDSFDPMAAAVLLMFSMVMPFAAGIFSFIAWIRRVFWKVRRWAEI